MIADFHSHLIPGVDDGAATLDQALRAIETMHGQGIDAIVTTPHLNASELRRKADWNDAIGRLDRAWEQLQVAAADKFPNVRLERGVELALDEPELARDDHRLRLAGTDFMLVEFPRLQIPPNSAAAIGKIVRAKIIPVIAHPERYVNFDLNFSLTREWRDAGALLQVNAGSVTGAFGRRAQQIALELIRQQLADYLSSDYHARGDCATSAAVAILAGSGFGLQSEKLTAENPQRMLKGLAPVAP